MTSAEYEYGTTINYSSVGDDNNSSPDLEKGAADTRLCLSDGQGHPHVAEVELERVPSDALGSPNAREESVSVVDLSTIDDSKGGVLPMSTVLAFGITDLGE